MKVLFCLFLYETSGTELFCPVIVLKIVGPNIYSLRPKKMHCLINNIRSIAYMIRWRAFLKPKLIPYDGLVAKQPDVSDYMYKDST